MPFSVNNNASASAALQQLNLTNRALSGVQAHINSGFKIATAKDNASTFAIAQGMRGDIAGLKTVSDSLALGLSTVNVALSAAQTISDTLNTMKQKAVQAQAPNVDRGKIQADIASLVQTIDSTAAAAQFNGVNLLNNTTTNLAVVSSLNRTSATTVTVANVNVAGQDLRSATIGIGGANVDVTGNNAVTFTSTSTATIANNNTFSITSGGITHVFEFVDGTVSTVTKSTPTQQAHTVLFLAGDSTQARLGKMFAVMRQFSFDVQNNEDGSFTVTSGAAMTAAATTATGITTGALGNNPAAALANIENAINSVKGSLAALGTAANQLTVQSDFVKQLTSTLQDGVSTLVDADLAEESATLQALQTKQQLGIQALSIANQQSGAVLSLFRQ